MNYCVQELCEVPPAAGSNCYMQAADYYAYFEDSPGYSGCSAQAVPSNNIYMEQAWAVNQPSTCSYPGNMLKNKDSDLDMALNQYSQPEYFPEEKPTFSQGQSPSYSQKKGRGGPFYLNLLKVSVVCSSYSLHQLCQISDLGC